MPGSGTPLVIATRKEGAEYHDQVTVPLTGLDLDANDTTLRNGSMQVAHNVRLNTQGDLTVRNGYDEFTRAHGTEPGSQSPIFEYPIAMMEYVAVKIENDSRQHVYRYVVTAFYAAVSETAPGTVNLWVLDKSSTDRNGVVVPLNVLFPTKPTGSIIEYAGAIMLSLFDDAIGSLDDPHNQSGVWELYPDNASDIFGKWKAFRLGQDLCPLPSKVAFADTAKGSLFINLSKNNGGSMEAILDSSGKQGTVEVKIDCPYWRSLAGVNAPASVMGERQYITNADEDALEKAYIHKHLAWHPAARAWGYRFVFRRRTSDVQGNPFIVTSSPSVDYWVQDNIYCPPVLGLPGATEAGANYVAYPSVITGKDSIGGGSGVDGDNHWRDQGNGIHEDVTNNSFIIDYDGTGPVTFNLAQGYPTNADYLNLRTLFRDSMLGSQQDVTNDPYFFAATWLGWWTKGNAKYPNRATPYQVAVPASKLKGAPLTIFDFADFHVDADVYEIDIFRTAHTEPQEKDNTLLQNQGTNAGDLLFQPHLYGYVGTISRGEIFTDDKPDTVIDFGTTPSDYDGLLKGQFTGQIMKEYNAKIALLNIRTSYWLNTPEQLQKPLIVAWSVLGLVVHGYSTGYIPNTDFVLAPDGLNVRAWCYTYVDLDGNESAPVDLSIAVADCQNPGASTHVDFVFPRGYDPSIVAIHLYESFYDAGTQHRGYSTAITVKASANMYQSLSPVGTSIGAYPSSRPQRTVKDHAGAADVIWTVRNNQFEWPYLNFEREHQFAPGTAMESILGENFIWTTVSTTLTKLDERSPRIEEENKWVGCIAPNCIAKYNQIVFFLSQFGLEFAQGSGDVQYPAKVYSECLKYLDEDIPGVPKQANARRASIGLNQQRKELYLYFPSSIDLWQSPAAVAKFADPSRALPQKMFVYKFLDQSGPRNSDIWNMANFTFDIHDSFEVKNAVGIDPPTPDFANYRSEQILFSPPHSDGGSFCAYFDKVTGQLTVLNMDYGDYNWPGRAMVEFSMSLQLPMTPKQLRSVRIKAALDCDAKIYTGNRKQSGAYDADRGYIDDRTRAFTIGIMNPGRPDAFQHTISPYAFESKGIAPRIRIVTQMNQRGMHRADYEGFEAYLSLKHHHP